MIISPDDLLEDERGVMLYEGNPFTGIAGEQFEGKVIFQESYVDGLKNGVQREWNRNGQLVYEENCYDNGTHGYCRRWSANGQLRYEVIGELGFLLSVKTWDEQGRRIRNEIYELEIQDCEWLGRLRKKRAEARERGIGAPPGVDPNFLPPE